MTLADLATPLPIALDTCSGSTPYDSRHSLWTRDSNTGAVGAMAMRPSDEVGEAREDRGVHTHCRRRSASGNRLMDRQITVHGSNIPRNPLAMAGRRMD